MSEESSLRIRSIFSTNLKQLVEGRQSISALCKEMGINRTQFNRFLNGESHPRPDVLKKICDFFDVDARILTEPLSKVRMTMELPGDKSLYLPSLIAPNRKHDRSSVFKPGFYKFWKNSFKNPGLMTMSLVYLYEKQEMLQLRGVVYFGLAKHQAEKPIVKRPLLLPVQRSFSGVFFREVAGHAFLWNYSAHDLPLMFGFVTQDDLFPNYFRGYAGAAKVEHSDQVRLSRCVYEHVPNKMSDAKRALSEIGIYSQANVPELVRTMLAPSEPVV